jgi:opacity protein-like surface antigen
MLKRRINFLILLLLLPCLVINAQEGSRVVVFLKTGYTVRGEIIKEDPGKSLTLRTFDGSIIEYNHADIEKVLPESKAKGSEPETTLLFHYGISSTTLTAIDYTTTFDRKLNFVPGVLGIGSEVSIYHFLKFQAELNLEKKDFISKDSIFSVADIGMNYLSIPLFIKFEVGSKAKFSIGVGGFGGFLLKDPMKENNRWPRKSIKRFDSGILLSAGVEYSINENISLLVDARYNKGLINLKDDFGEAKFYTDAISFQIGFGYRL